MIVRCWNGTRPINRPAFLGDPWCINDAVFTVSESIERHTNRGEVRLREGKIAMSGESFVQRRWFISSIGDQLRVPEKFPTLIPRAIRKQENGACLRVSISAKIDVTSKSLLFLQNLSITQTTCHPCCILCMSCFASIQVNQNRLCGNQHWEHSSRTKVSQIGLASIGSS